MIVELGCLQDVVAFSEALADPSGFHIGECQLEFPAVGNRRLRAVNRVAPAHAPVRPAGSRYSITPRRSRILRYPLFKVSIPEPAR
jgi:hypothetical protein